MEFDKEKVYDEQINPLIKQIIEICEKNKIPGIASFCYKTTDGIDSFCTTFIPLAGEGLPDAFEDCRTRLLKNQHIIKSLLS
jgi:hypothetical protein